MRVLCGLPASPGIAIGPALRFRRARLSFQRQIVADKEAEWTRFLGAVEAARQQLQEVQAKAEAVSGAGSTAILQAQMLMLEDPELLEQVRTAIEEAGVNAEAALGDAVDAYIRILEALDNEYLRARSADVRDVADRLLRILLGMDDSPLAALKVPSIILAQDLTPSDTAILDRSLVLGFCTAEGGATSHTAILARALGLPAVVGAGAGVLEVASEAPLVLDAGEGILWVDPDTATLARYRARQKAGAARLAVAEGRAHEPAVTRDGHRVAVAANIGDVAGAQAAVAAGAEGVGLLRSEFLYLGRATIPSEEEQYRAYRRILEVLGGRPVILRTLDIGGDKELRCVQLPREANPFLGLRGIRLSLARPELFKPQLRAALRAGVGHKLKIMFPMVATVAEVRAAREALEACRSELVAEGNEVTGQMEVGIMVEVPSAALLAGSLAREVDFFSIGTNDLSQYTMAADRTNAQVAHLASALQPAVLRLVRDVVAAAHAHGKWVGLCGELAAEPLAIPLLLGLGVDELSMNPPAVPVAKQVIRALTLSQARELAGRALALDSAEAVQALVRGSIVAPGIE